MLRRLSAGLCALAVIASPVLAQSACEPAKLAAAIDRYAMKPFSAQSWRMLKGLGDPMIEGITHGSDGVASRDKWDKLAGAILPDAKYLTKFGQECRIAYPLQVLQQRVSSLGKESRYVKQWLRAQDRVLAACSEPATTPVELPATLEIHPALQKMQNDDRAYQEASIAYYRDPENAVQLFRAVGVSNSVHRAAARYNIAGLLANARQFADARFEANDILANTSLASVQPITRELLGYIANREDTALGWTELINNTVKTIEQPLGAIQANETSRGEYAHALFDLEFAGVRGQSDDWWLDGRLPANPTLSKALADTARSQPMVLFMIAGQSVDRPFQEAPWSLIGTTWETQTNNTINKALAAAPAAQDLPLPALEMLDAARTLPTEENRQRLWGRARAAMAAAEKSCGNDPLTATAGYLFTHAVRISAMTGHADEAITELEKVQFSSSTAYYSTIVRRLGEYLLGKGKLAEARELRDHLLTPAFFGSLPKAGKPEDSDRFAEFVAWIAEDEAHWKAALALHSRKMSSLLLNFQSSQTLWRLADDPVFSTPERALLARVAWTRGYARGITQTPEHTAKLYELNPPLRETAQKVASEYPIANGERQRLLTILRSPRFGILVGAPDLWNGIKTVRDDFNEVDIENPNDENWWCPFQTDRQLGGLRDQFNTALGLDVREPAGNVELDGMYDPEIRAGLNSAGESALRSHPMVKSVDWREIDALSKMDSAPETLTQSALRWGRKTGVEDEDGAPEALALAVRSTRYGCRWSGRHGNYSKAAQELLQEKFKATTWAEQTPQWFDCPHDEGLTASIARDVVCETRTWPKQPPLR